ncbi:hypothetical protein [Mesorhizobium sp. L-8-3]|uniref:hypothetical protein n=1 Tax=Mesorhizobium sp. L-8-3 TaxID=2744522 RepID=UPI0019279CD4|nr:hypothetical protein [Mesorhizobium sp. L-8-3]BCH25779.1 hypothetical protein MesoLjLb_55640 [Mesorhizobium sp. L-8-3]
MTYEPNENCADRYGRNIQYNTVQTVKSAQRMRAAGLERYLSRCERRLLELADREATTRAQRAAVAEAAKGPKTVYRGKVTYSVNGFSPNGVKIGRPRKADGGV